MRQLAIQLAKDDLANGEIHPDQFVRQVEAYLRWLAGTKTRQEQPCTTST